MPLVQNQPPALASHEAKALRPVRAMGFAAILVTFLTWAWWPFIGMAVEGWFEAPNYGVGLSLLVLGFAVVWVRRNQVKRSPLRMDGLGLFIVVAAIFLRFAGTALDSEFAAGASWLLALVGISVVCAGRNNCPWLLPPILFLGFLLPLPYRTGHAGAEPLQQMVTDAATYFAQLCGYPAVNSNALLLVNDATVDVAAHCVGFESLVPFLALATGLSMLVNRPWWQRLVLVTSAAPIGIYLIGSRVAIQGMLESNGEAAAPWITTHGVWLSLVAAAVVLLVELWVLANILLEPDVLPIGGGSGLRGTTPIVVSGVTSQEVAK